MTTETPPEGLTFTPSNSELDGGWMPRIDQGDCPACMGSDDYGQPSFCGECEYCCGC